MPKLRAFWIRLRGFFGIRRDDDDFDAELESHIELHTDDGIRAGLTPEEARRQALIRLGGAEQTRQAVRERRGLPWLESLLRDLALRIAHARQASRRNRCGHPLHRPRHRRQRHHLFHGQSLRAASRAHGRPDNIARNPHHPRRRECCNNFPYPVYADLRDQANPSPGWPHTTS